MSMKAEKIRLLSPRIWSSTFSPQLSPHLAMAFRLASSSASASTSTPAVPSSSTRRSASSSCASSDSEEDDQDNFEDWKDESAPSVPATSLFGNKEFKSVEEAAAFDISENGVDFVKQVARLGEWTSSRADGRRK